MTAIDHILGIGDSNVVSPAEWSPRRRAHLQQLLDVRARLAATAAEQRSHDLPERTDILHVLWAVEETIRESWPQVYYTQFPQWAAEEEGLLHELPMQDCSVCAADATHGGVDNQPPEAA